MFTSVTIGTSHGHSHSFKMPLRTAGPVVSVPTPIYDSTQSTLEYSKNAFLLHPLKHCMDHNVLGRKPQATHYRTEQSASLILILRTM